MLSLWILLGCKDDAAAPAAAAAGDLWYPDADGDGYGDSHRPLVSPTQPEGAVDTPGDCDDGDPDISPGAEETCGDDIDEDCDGCPAACSPAEETRLCGLAEATEHGSEGSRFGEALASADTDGDGLAELLIGAPLHSTALMWTGAVLTEGHTLAGTGASDSAGGAVASAGDVDGDGLEDVLVGAWREDSAEDSDGGAAWLLYGPLTSTTADAADARLQGTSLGGWSGRAVASAGDVDGDGFDDVLVGTPRYRLDGDVIGSASLLYGPISGTLRLPQADATVHGEAIMGEAGWSVAGAGDTDGDGLSDLLVGAPADGGGRAVLVLGPVSGDLTLSDGIRLDGAVGRRGWAVSGAGDVDDDGLADVLVGVPDSGVVEVFLGGQPGAAFSRLEGAGEIVRPGLSGQVLVGSASCLFHVLPTEGVVTLTDGRCAEAIGSATVHNGALAVGLPEQNVVFVLGAW